MFGAAASAPAFSFGQPTSGASVFGSQTSSPFGTGFGQTSSAPAFGQPSATPAFGQTSAFGFAQTPASSAAASSGGFFGQQTGGNLFGTNTQASTGFGVSSFSTGGGLFGGTSAFGQSPLFGASSAAAATTSQPLALPTTVGIQDSAAADLHAIQDAYDDQKETFQFRHLFLSIVTKEFFDTQKHPHLTLPPLGVNRLQWRNAVERAGGLNNPQCLWPIEAKGFQGLLDRKAAQDQALKEDKQYADQLLQAVSRLQNSQTVVVQQRLAQLRKDQKLLSAQLLKVLRKLDAVQGGYRRTVDYASSNKQLAALNTKLVALEDALFPPYALVRKADAIVANNLQVRLSASLAAKGWNSELEQQSCEEISRVLKDQMAFMKELVALQRDDQRDIAIMQHGSFQLGLT